MSKQEKPKKVGLEYAPGIQITDNLKNDIVARFTTTSQKTLLGFAFYNFSLNACHKTNEDFEILLIELHAQMKDEPLVMKQILGSDFHYFEELFRRHIGSRN